MLDTWNLHNFISRDVWTGKWIYIYGTPFLVALYKDMGRKVNHHQCTSSTAQGGGGSFKNRKPIGEVGCCESGMAERSHWWTERWLISPTLSLSLLLSFSLSLSFSDYLPTYLPIYLSVYLSIVTDIHLERILEITSWIFNAFWTF